MRRKILRAWRAGIDTYQIGAWLRVPESYVYRVIARNADADHPVVALDAAE